jgi:ribosomal protein S18 acetylase RimI-like enzyme
MKPPSAVLGEIRLRPLRRSDRAPLEAILRATEVFHEAEIDIALELIDAPESAGYRFIVAELEDRGTAGDRTVGYACFGATPLAAGVYDLYWIAVDPSLHGAGVGRKLMDATLAAIRADGGRMVMIETASKPSYDKTRAFYLAYGCREVARVPDFYDVGDDKVIYAHVLR